MASSHEPRREAARRQFRSSGETQIARLLNRYGISFRYEQPAAVVDRGKVRLWYPDFHLSDQGIFIEYCGRPHDPAYADGMAHKRAVYAANGLTTLMFTPDLFRGNWPATVLDRIEGALSDRLGAFRAARYDHGASIRALRS